MKYIFALLLFFCTFSRRSADVQQILLGLQQTFSRFYWGFSRRSAKTHDLGHKFYTNKSRAGFGSEACPLLYLISLLHFWTKLINSLFEKTFSNFFIFAHSRYVLNTSTVFSRQVIFFSVHSSKNWRHIFFSSLVPYSLFIIKFWRLIPSVEYSNNNKKNHYECCPI